jgi:hypothetical protein
LLPRYLVISSVRLPVTDPPRSALPLAAIGIACLGFVPTFGGPDRPLHWAMTAGMVGVGALLCARHWLSRREGALRPVASADARLAGKTVLIVCGISTLLVLGIVFLQWLRGGQLGAFSLAMPVAGLLWLATLGVQSLKHRDAAAPEPGLDRPSRRSAKVEGLPSPSQRPSQPPTDRRISA